jgi:hypothetical protein
MIDMRRVRAEGLASPNHYRVESHLGPISVVRERNRTVASSTAGTSVTVPRVGLRILRAGQVVIEVSPCTATLSAQSVGWRWVPPSRVVRVAGGPIDWTLEGQGFIGAVISDASHRRVMHLDASGRARLSDTANEIETVLAVCCWLGDLLYAVSPWWGLTIA